MDANTTIKNFLKNRCIDFNALAKRINRDPQEFQNALDGKFSQNDERNLTANDLIAICNITNSTPSEILGC